MPGEGGVFSTQGQVRLDGTPFVASFINDERFGTLSPAEAIALGIRAIQSAIEAERDAGLIAFLKSIDVDEAAINAMLTGLREYRVQYDPPEGLGN